MKIKLKKLVYTAGASVVGKKSPLATQRSAGEHQGLMRLLQKENTQDFCIATFDKQAQYIHSQAVNEHTLFRLASITKWVVGILVMRLQEAGVLRVEEDISIYLGSIRNPQFPNTPIQIAHLLSHSSGIIDSPAYFQNLQNPLPYQEVLAFAEFEAGTKFLYSNFAAGLLEIIVEKATGKSLETLLQEYIFAPLQIQGTLFPTIANAVPNVYRVFPKQSQANFSVDASSAQKHSAYRALALEQCYLKASGALCMSAYGLLKLLQTVVEDANEGKSILLSQTSIAQMQSARVVYPKKERHLEHGLATLIVKDSRIYKGTLYGHQGFAYGAVNAAFYDVQAQKAFVFLNAGTREYRNGHFSHVTEKVLRYFYGYC
ncbi:MAG: serine hydrolase domain-containing protein [Eubacteriales bacterium]|nr:serine hydrolase domain-containing protein [Eubacteriales bacterium]